MAQVKNKNRILLLLFAGGGALLLLIFLFLFLLVPEVQLKRSAGLELSPPQDQMAEDSASIKETKVLTLILGADDKVHYYKGQNPKVNTTALDSNRIRPVIKEHLAKKNDEDSDWDPIIVIKPSKESRYKNLVDILDEMRISEVPKYALSEVTRQDSFLLEEETNK